MSPANDRNLLPAVADADPSTEEDLDLPGETDREETGVLQEERPLLRKKEVEAVQVDLLLIDLHLGKVGVEGQFHRQAGCHAVLEVSANVPKRRGPHVGLTPHGLPRGRRGSA